MKIAAIYHVAHEGLGTLEPPLLKAGADLLHVHAYKKQASFPQITDIDGLIVMGGPMGVSEQNKYPFLKKELTLLQQAIARKKPILGICLGAQLLATALKSKIASAFQQEIGWFPIMREPDVDGDPLCGGFGQTETIFQWHGETFELPKASVRLFSGPIVYEQAFRYGDFAYGFQFHIETDPTMIQAWMKLPANAALLRKLQKDGVLDPAMIRGQIKQHAPRIKKLSNQIARGFVDLVRHSVTGVRRTAHA